jgi:hypothetical protein
LNSMAEKVCRTLNCTKRPLGDLTRIL